MTTRPSYVDVVHIPHLRVFTQVGPTSVMKTKFCTATGPLPVDRQFYGFPFIWMLWWSRELKGKKIMRRSVNITEHFFQFCRGNLYYRVFSLRWKFRPIKCRLHVPKSCLSHILMYFRYVVSVGGYNDTKRPCTWEKKDAKGELLLYLHFALFT